MSEQEIVLTLPYALGVLSVLVALNFTLTLRLLRVVAVEGFNRVPATRPLGFPLPSVRGRRIGGQRVSSKGGEEGSKVLVFISPKCPACRQEAPLLRRFGRGLETQGVTFWAVVQGRRGRIADTFGELEPYLVLVSKRDASVLNPKASFPSYLFVDASGQVAASGFVGDEDWRSVCAQVGAATSDEDGEST